MRTMIVLLLGIFPLYLVSEENFILIDGSSNSIIEEFGPNINDRVSPACSFNIVLSLMGYDSGILKNETMPIWDFQEGYDDFLESWKTSQTPQSWMRQSCVWVSKMIALQIGLKTIQSYLALLDYGNQDFSTGLIRPGLANPAWVSSSLKISPREQVNFIQKMISGKLPVSNHALQMTRRLLLKEELFQGWKLYGKTGLSSVSKETGEILKIRWFVGWVEKGLSFFPFAYQMREKEIDTLQTAPRVKQLLEQSNLREVNQEL